MDTTTLFLCIIIALILSGTLAYLFWMQKKEANHPSVPNNNHPQHTQLQLQAYERLILLCERIALPNVLTRLNIADLTAKEVQQLWIAEIKKEFEYNVTQQIYVTAKAWDAIKKLKDQNIYIINQVSVMLPESATAMDLSKRILDYIIKENIAQLHELVSAAISAEAKTIL